MLKSCWVVHTEMGRSLVKLVKPGAGFDKMSGMADDEIAAEDNALIKKPVVNNEEYDVGLKLTLRSTDTRNEYTRFLSLSDIDEMVFHQRFNPPITTPDLATIFGNMLVKRKHPITIAIMDRNVDLDNVVRSIGNTEGSLKGNEPGISSMQRDEDQ